MLIYRKIFLFGLCFFLGTVSAFAQTDRHDVRKGNRDFKKERYAEAQIDYSKGLIKDSSSFAANYNLGNTLYRMGDSEQALKSYSKLQEVAAFSPEGDKLMYNIGNASAMGEDWQTAVDAYKASLLMNPGDIEAKENYIYAKSKLEDQENEDQDQDGGGGGEGGDDDQDQNQDQDQNGGGDDDQNQDQNSGGNDDQNDQNQDQDQDQNGGGNEDQNQDQQQGQGQGQPEISPQQAQQMLQAIQAKDNETQEKVNKEKADVMKKKQREKNW